MMVVFQSPHHYPETKEEEEEEEEEEEQQQQQNLPTLTQSYSYRSFGLLLSTQMYSTIARFKKFKLISLAVSAFSHFLLLLLSSRWQQDNEKELKEKVVCGQNFSRTT